MPGGGQKWTWLTVRSTAPSAAGFDLRQWTIILAMAVWVWLNALDLLVTYQGLRMVGIYEANRAMAGLIRHPIAAITVKMMLAYLLLKLIERLETRRPYSGLSPLLAANIYLSWACLHNLQLVRGHTDWSLFLRFFPLVGPPG